MTLEQQQRNTAEQDDGNQQREQCPEPPHCQPPAVVVPRSGTAVDDAVPDTSLIPIADKISVCLEACAVTVTDFAVTTTSPVTPAGSEHIVRRDGRCRFLRAEVTYAAAAEHGARSQRVGTGPGRFLGDVRGLTSSGQCDPTIKDQTGEGQQRDHGQGQPQRRRPAVGIVNADLPDPRDLAGRHRLAESVFNVVSSSGRSARWHDACAGGEHGRKLAKINDVWSRFLTILW